MLALDRALVPRKFCGKILDPHAPCNQFALAHSDKKLSPKAIVLSTGLIT
jgi:hypothetical protein